MISFYVSYGINHSSSSIVVVLDFVAVVDIVVRVEKEISLCRSLTSLTNFLPHIALFTGWAS